MIKYYQFDQQYYTTGLALNKGTYENVTIEEEFLKATFYFPDAIETKIFFKDIHIISSSTIELYSNPKVLKGLVGKN